MKCNASFLLLAGCLVVALAATVGAQDGRDGGGSCSPNCPANQDGRIPRRSTQQLVCKPCKPGSFKNSTTNCCQECEGILTFDAAGVPNGCTPCPLGSKGFFDKTTNTSSCWCKDGFQASGPAGPTGVPGCVACAPGTFNPNRTQSPTACLPCPANTVAPRNASERCIPCFNGSVAVNSTTCLCLPGNYVKLAGKGPKPPRGGGGRHRMLLKDGAPDDKKNGGPDGGMKPDDDLWKRAYCAACNATTENSQLPGNLWPACCAAGTSWNGTACV